MVTGTITYPQYRMMACDSNILAFDDEAIIEEHWKRYQDAVTAGDPWVVGPTRVGSFSTALSLCLLAQAANERVLALFAVSVEGARGGSESV